MKHGISHAKRIGKACLVIGAGEQILIRDDNQRVYHFLKRSYPFFGLLHAALAFKLEWFGYNPYGQDALLACCLGNNGRRPRACTAAHAGSDEHHIAI